MNSGFFEKIQTKNIIWAVIVFFYVSFLGALGFFAYSNAATVYTVCDSGCDFTTIDAAITGSTDEDTIRVVDGYTGAGEAATLALHTSSTLECVGSPSIGNTGATTTIQYDSGVVIQNCTFVRTAMGSSLDGGLSVEIAENTFDETYPGIINVDRILQVAITNNQNIGSLVSNTTGATLNISGNTFTTGNYQKILFSIPGFSSVSVTENIFSTELNHAGTFIFISADSIVFATNTISMSGAQTSSVTAVILYPSGSAYVGGNFIDVAAEISPLNIQAFDNNVTANIKHNTIKHVANVISPGTNFGAHISSAGHTGMVTDFSYNLITNYGASEPEIAVAPNTTGGGDMTFTESYNATYGNYLFTTDELRCDVGVTGCAMGPTWRSQKNPQLRIWNASTADDLYPAPWSDLLDVNGTLDIGAYSGSRRTTIYVNGSAPIDYSAVDATSTASIFASNNVLRPGDTVQYASGSYDLQSITTTTIANNLTITGAGVGATTLYAVSGGTTITDLENVMISNVTIRATQNTNALAFNNTSNSTVSNVVFDSASSTRSVFVSGRMIFDYNGSTYDDTDDLSMPPASTIVFYDAGCMADQVSVDGTDISAFVDGTSNIHLALIDIGGSKLTALVPNDYVASAAALEADCSGFGAVVDRWVANVFTVSGGVYSYDASAVSAQGVTLTSGYATPSIVKIGGYFGVSLINSTGNTFTNVTSTNNAYNFYFGTGSYSNVITDSNLTSSTQNDFIAINASGTNQVKNTEFNHASTTIASSGTLSIYQKISIIVKNILEEFVGGAVINFSSANESVIGTATTTVDGTTPYTTDLLASVFTSTTTAPTAGGYNPYTFSISATSTYGATTTAVNLTEPYQAITIYLTALDEEEEDSPAPTPPPSTNISQPSQDPAPIITGFKINNGEVVTPTTTVLISLSASNAMQMVVSTDQSFQNIAAVPYQSSFTTSLSTTPGVTTFYARVFNAQGVASEISSATIEYNPTAPPIAPTGSVSMIGSIDGSMTSSTQVTLLFAYSTQVTDMIVSANSNFSAASWQQVTSTLPWTLASGDGVKHVYVKYRNAQNLESPVYTASVILDQTGPAKPLFIGAIENGSFTQSPSSIAGTSEPNARITLRLMRGAVLVFEKNISANSLGVWSASIDTPLSLGTYSVSATAQDSIGNTGAANTTTFVITAQQVEEEPETETEPEPVVPPKNPESTPLESGAEQGENGQSGSVGSETGSSSAVGGGSGSDITVENTTKSDNEKSDFQNSIEVPELENRSEISIISSEKITEDVRVVGEKIVEATKTVGASVNKATKKTVQVVKTVQAIPEVQVANQAVVVPAAAAISVAAVSGAVNGAQALTYLQFLFTQPAFLLARRRRKGWGVVYNAITKMPADLATVRLIDSATGRIVQSRVTDQMGRYQFFAKPGSYTIDISKPNYQFPVSYLQGKKEDGKYLDLYTGGAVNAVSAAALSFNAPLDPVGADKPLEQLVRAERKKMFAALFGSIGLAVTAVSFVISPTPLVGGFLVLHAVSHFMFRRIAIPKKPESWGVVSGPDGKPLEQAVIRVFDKQYNKLLDTQVTDDKGRYAFLVGKNDYYLMIEKPGFQKVVTDTITVPEVEGGSVLAANVQLQK